MTSNVNSDVLPFLQGNGEYANWKIKFAEYVRINLPDFWSLLEEKKIKDQAYLILTKCISSHVLAICKMYKTAYEVLKELEWRFGKEDSSKTPKLEDEESNHSQASVLASLSTTNAELLLKVDVLSTELRRCRENEKVSKNKMEVQHREVRDLKAKISSQQAEIDSLLNEIGLLKTVKKVVKTEPSSSSAPVNSVPVSTKKDTEAEVALKKNKGKAKASTPEKNSAFPVGSTSKPPVFRVSVSQPSAEKGKVKHVCCFYCKTHGHLVKDCVLLSEKRRKRKEMLQHQAQQKINNDAPVTSSTKKGRYVPPHAREKIFVSTPVPQKQVFRVVSPTAEVRKKTVTKTTNVPKKPFNTLKAKAKGEYSEGKFSSDKVAFKLLERLLSDFQRIMEVSVQKGHTGWKQRRLKFAGQHARAQAPHA